MEENRDEIDPTINMLEAMGVESIGVDRVRGIGRGGTSSSKESEYQELCGHCWRGTLCIGPDGSAFPCIMSKFYPVGNAQDGLDAVLQGKALQRFRRRMAKEEETIVAQCAPERGPCRPMESCSPEGCCPKTICGPRCAPKS